ncbi:hypothetical protein [Flavobacterium cerinum]|uniref:Uncharacterized protein n=1 Tax=Flavobacterium cerinum TaxID=2502784 RepID=A0ABY5IYZ6_9FLAO|nr:hypothetical protein [Flavobacterium cerinum]UUC46716.1 hypothetical protein NOX80_05830 [Flavobacterium cerinum]
MRQNKKASLIILISILVVGLFIYLNQKRYFLDLPNNQSITVWKKMGNECYITSGKYYGISEPDNFIKTSNVNDISLFFTDRLPKKILLDGENCVIQNKSNEDVIFDNYVENKNKYRGIIYKSDAKKNSDVNDDVTIVNINIGGMNVTDKYGEKIE